MKYMQLELGGEKRGLKFNVGTLKRLNENFDIDPLHWQIKESTLQEVLPYVEKITFAALINNCIANGHQPNFTFEMVQRWVEDLDPEQIAEIATIYNSMLTGKQKASTEGGENTQSNV